MQFLIDKHNAISLYHLKIAMYLGCQNKCNLAIFH